MAKGRSSGRESSGGGFWKWILGGFAALVFGNLDAYDRLIYDFNHEQQTASAIGFWCAIATEGSDTCIGDHEIDVSLVGNVTTSEVYEASLPEGVHRISVSEAVYDKYFIGDSVPVGVASGTIMNAVRYQGPESGRAFKWYSAIAPAFTLLVILGILMFIFRKRPENDAIEDDLAV